MKDKKSIEGILSSVFLFSVFVIIIIQILIRLFPLFNLVWTEELSRWMWVWTVCIGWGELERGKHHLKMDFLQKKFNKNVQLIIKIVSDIVYIMVAINIFVIGVQQVVKTIYAVSVTLSVGIYFLYLGLPLGLLFVIVRVCIRIVKNITIIKNRYVVKDIKL